MSYVMVAMAGAGLLKGLVLDREKEGRQRKLAAETQRMSPWTGLKANPIQEADPLGSAIAFGATGAQLKGGMDQQALNKKLAEKALADNAPTTVAVNTGTPNMAMSPYQGMMDNYEFGANWRKYGGYGG